MNAHEEAIIRAFVAPARRSRWLEALASSKRGRFLDRLNHCTDLDPRYVTPVVSGVDVAAVLRSLGAPATCSILSATAELDGREMPLAEAVEAVMAAGWGTLISCVPGRLAFYYDECGERRFVLRRPA